jgi:hypothetical protein
MKEQDIYKNLDHAYEAYFQAEGFFPLWEAAFALIVGQIFVAYFDPDICKFQQNSLSAIGFIISLIWFLLVSLNLQNALHLAGRIKLLQNQFNKNNYLNQKLIYPWPDNKDTWTWDCIFWGTRPIKDLIDPISEKKRTWIAKNLKSTWFYRRILPLIAGLYWISIYNSYIFYLIISVVLLLFFLKFDPKKEKDAIRYKLAAIKNIKYRDLDYDTAKKEVMGYFQERGEAYPSEVEEDLELDYELVCQITEELKREGRLGLL